MTPNDIECSLRFRSRLPHLLPLERARMLAGLADDIRGVARADQADEFGN